LILNSLQLFLPKPRFQYTIRSFNNKLKHCRHECSRIQQGTQFSDDWHHLSGALPLSRRVARHSVHAQTTVLLVRRGCGRGFHISKSGFPDRDGLLGWGTLDIGKRPRTTPCRDAGTSRTHSTALFFRPVLEFLEAEVGMTTMLNQRTATNRAMTKQLQFKVKDAGLLTRRR